MAVETTFHEARTEDVGPVHTRIRWGPVFAGAGVALAVGIFFMALGAAIGLSASEEKTPGTGFTIYAGIVSLISLFVGGWIMTQCAVGESRFESVVYGVVLWSLMFVGAGWLATTGVHMGLMGFNAAASAASTPQAQQALEGARQGREPAAQVQNEEQLRAQAQQLQERVREVAPRAAWGTFFGVCLSLLASIMGALVGSGPRVLFHRYERGVVTGPAVPPTR